MSVILSLDDDRLPIDWYAYTSPAYCALILHWVAGGYQRSDSSSALPLFAGVWSLSLVLPTALRAKLPKSSSAKLSTILNEIDVRQKGRVFIRAVVQPFWRGYRYGIACGVLEWRSDGIAAVGDVRSGTGNPALVAETRKVARALGGILRREVNNGGWTTFVEE